MPEGGWPRRQGAPVYGGDASTTPGRRTQRRMSLPYILYSGLQTVPMSLVASVSQHVFDGFPCPPIRTREGSVGQPGGFPGRGSALRPAKEVRRAVAGTMRLTCE